MLVLSRKKRESICIGPNITITVVEIRGNHVRLGIEAPSDVAVHRREVFEAIQRSEDVSGNQPYSKDADGTTPEATDRHDA
jgi:carbon storage regulator